MPRPWPSPWPSPGRARGSYAWDRCARIRRCSGSSAAAPERRSRWTTVGARSSPRRDNGGGRLRPPCGRRAGTGRSELRPEELVRDLVVVLHLGGLDECAEGLGAAFGLGELDLGELGVHLLPQHLLHEPAPLEL